VNNSLGETTTKIKLYLFLCIICLLFNLSFCAVSFATNSVNITIDTGSEDDKVNVSGYNNTVDSAIVATGVGVGTSFLPWIGLINIATLNLASVPLLVLFYALVTIIISILQTALIALIILNMLPFFNA
jgi:hypothetical protein